MASFHVLFNFVLLFTMMKGDNVFINIANVMNVDIFSMF